MCQKCQKYFGVHITVTRQAENTTRKLSYRKDDRAMRLIWVSWEMSVVGDYAHGYFSQFLRAFLPIDAVNMRTKFVRSS